MKKIAVLVVVLSLVSFSALSVAAEYTVWPTGQTNCTGYTDYADKHDGPVLVHGGTTTGTVRKGNGYLKFDLSAIPDSTTVTAVTFNFYVNNGNWPYWSVTPLALDSVPIASTAALLWDDAEAEATIGYYNLQDEADTFAPGWKTLVLGGTATADLNAALSLDWFSLGAVSRDTTPTYYLEIDGHDGPNVPYLVVFDDPAPSNDTCAGATVVPGAPGSTSYSGDTTFAVNDYDCSAFCVGGSTHGGTDVVYSLTLPAGCQVCVTLNQSEMTWNGAVYMVTDCDDVNGTCVAGASGWLAGGEDEVFCYSDTGIRTYYIIVDGRTGGGSGAFRLDLDVSCLAGPDDLTCSEVYHEVELSWTNNEIYDGIEVYGNGELLATLAGTATSYMFPRDPGYHCFHVCGVAGTDVACSNDCCLIVGYNWEIVLWDLESDDGGFVVDGTGAWQWGAPVHGPCAGTADGNVWATDLDADYANTACWLLDTQVIELGFGGFLAIDHCYEMEDSWDGGVVWFTTDDHWYYTFEPLEGTDGVITADAGCGWVAGRNGFTGDSDGWVTDVWDFTGEMWHEETVKFRFAFGSDSSVATYSGWMIDNITIYMREHAHPIDCYYTVTPPTGTVPFQTMHQITLWNSLVGGLPWTRRHAARIAVTIGNGSTYNPWRAGFTNIAPGEYYFTQFPVNLPQLGSVIGTNTFTLSAMDVTPAPYNQPPYPPAGSTCTMTNIVVANAP